MGYVKEPTGIDFVIEPNKVTDKDRKLISEAIDAYRRNQSITKVSKIVAKQK